MINILSFCINLTGSNLCFIPTPSQALRATITNGVKDLDAEKRGIQTKRSLKFEHRGAPLTVL